MKPWSFRTKLTLLNGASVLIMVCSVGWLLTYTTQRLAFTSVDRDLLMRADVFAIHGDDGSREPRRDGPGRPDRPGPPPPPQNDSQGLSRPRFYNPEGTRLDHNDGDTLDAEAIKTITPTQTRLSTISIEGARVRVVTIRYNSRTDDPIVVQFGHGLADYDRLVATQTQLLLILLPIAVLVACGAGWFLTNRALGPVEALALTASKITDQNLDTRLQVTGQDELAKLAQTFNQMIERLEGSFEQKEALLHQIQEALIREKQFVGDASHELRTPLARLMLTTSSALSQASDEQELREALKIADQAGESMNRLVQQLLTLARTDGYQEEKAFQDVNLANLAKEVIENFTRPVTLEITENSTVQGDASDLRRAMTNLVENALRYTPESGTVKVVIGHNLFRVEDTGAGIDPKHLPHVTERFYRADAARSRKDGGCGLGLSIVKAIAEQHGGELRIESELGKGTTAIVLLGNQKKSKKVLDI